MTRLGLLSFLCFFIIPAITASAEPTPTEGIPVPDGSITTQSDSGSLELNPAGLGFVEGGELSYGFTRPTGDYRGVIPSGHSLSLVGGGRTGGLGVGLQWMDNPRLGPDRSSFRKITFGGGLAPSPHVSLGGNINFFSSRTDERLNDLRTTELGLQVRPASIIGAGLVTRDLGSSFLTPQRALPRRHGVGVAFRPFDGRLVFDAEFHHVRGGDQFELRPRIAAEPYPGLRVFGHGSVDVPRPDRAVDWDLARVSVGLETSFGTAGAQAQAQTGQGSSAEITDLTAMSYRFWSGTPQKRSLYDSGNRWIRLSVDDAIEEQARRRFFAPPTSSFLELINDIDAIAQDPTVDGVVVEIGDFTLGYAQLWELHNALQRLDDAGKQSLALIMTETPTTGIVYAASAADEVWMQPSTPYAPTGFQVEFTSYAGLFDRLGIEAEFMRTGDYKSAPESYVLPDEPTQPALEQTGEYLDTLYHEVTERIASQRQLTGDEVRALVDDTPIYPATALDEGLVDAVVYGDEIDDRLRRLTGSSFGPQSGYERFRIADERWGSTPEIAVVYIDGLITSGESGTSPFGSASITGAETVTEILRQLRDDNNVKAVVVRVDSGGGSAVGSDLIYRELRHLAQRKPVVASMGNVAASGGYYVAAGADEIVATPVTLTGSIGVYAGKFNVQSLANRLGITVHPERRGDRAGVFSPWRPWSDSERQGVAEALEYFYQLFLDQVAQTRPLSADEVNAVAQGRVWTGQAASQKGLIDSTGGLTDAIRRAEAMSGLEPGEAEYVDRTGAGGIEMSPTMGTPLRQLAQRIGVFDDGDIARPDGQLPSAIKELEGLLLWPLYFQADEPVFLLPQHISFD